jgi:hypothetical protein
MLGYSMDVGRLAADSNSLGFRARAVRIFRRARKVFRSHPVTALGPLSHLGGAALLLEYLENGSLLQLQNRLVRENIHLPNRLLWSWYFCCKKGCLIF